jgi:hypothetical protein
MSICRPQFSSGTIFSLVFLVSTLAPILANAQSSLSLDEKLAAIRQGFVKAAIEGPTKVQSTVWIDSNGSLQESSSFKTGMAVRGVRVLVYARDEQGQPTADMSWQPEAEQKTVQKNPNQVVSCEAGGLKHVIGFDINSGEEWGVDERSPLRTATHSWAQHWTRASTSHVQWKQRLSTSANRSAYEKAFLGSSADEMPWQANLTLRPLAKRVTSSSLSVSSAVGARLPSSKPDESNIQLHFTLTARNQQTPAFEASADFAWRFEAQNWSAPELSLESQQLLLQQIKNWSSDVHKLLECESVMPEVIHASSESLRVNAGRLAGLRIGDELLLANGKNFIRKILEPGVISESVMTKVVSVSEHHAQLLISPGAKTPVQLGWRAWTTEINR